MADTSEAPGELELVRDFVNTLHIDPGVRDEKLERPEQLRDWLAEHGLPGGDSELDDSDLHRAIGLRESLRSLLLANNGEGVEDNAIDTLNSAAGELSLKVQFDEHGRPALAPAGKGIEAALAAILAIVYRSMAEGTWPRLKACRADECWWAFYDHSRNRSGTWCDMAVCGNRAKARTYRHRHKQADDAPSI
jgi:predicted RNA-binding Zn ribbon-like protein